MSGRNLVPLGLDDRDRLNAELGGGIPRGSIVIMEGQYGAGKSALTQRFTYGICEEGHTTTFLSTELTVTNTDSKQWDFTAALHTYTKLGFTRYTADIAYRRS